MEEEEEEEQQQTKSGVGSEAYQPKPMQNTAPDAQLFQLLSGLLHQLSNEALLGGSIDNGEEVELRSKIETLGLEVTKVPSSSTGHLDELEIAKELDKLSTKLDDVDEMISSAIASDPHVQSLLSGTADIWMPVITASADERQNFAGPTPEGDARESEKAPM